QAGTAGQELTYTCVPPGSGIRMGIDRDEDGLFDRDELDAGTDPAHSATTSTTSPTTTTSTTTTAPPPPCHDGVRHGRETDVDCGGGCCCPLTYPWQPCLEAPFFYRLCVQSSCNRCRAGQRCVCNSDCESGVCEIVGGGLFQPLVHRCAVGKIPV